MNTENDNLLKLIEKTLDDNKAEDIVTIDLKGKTSIANYMVIASGTSNRHVASLADKLKYELKKQPVHRRLQFAVSNEITGNCAMVTVKKGGLYVIESREG